MTDKWDKQENRVKAKKAGHAMADGSYPIETAKDLADARRLSGRSKKHSKAQVDRHIARQEARLKREGKL